MLDTPWGPQFGIELQIRSDIDEVKVLRRTKPKSQADNIAIVEQTVAEHDGGKSKNNAAKTASRLEEPQSANAELWNHLHSKSCGKDILNQISEGQKDSKDLCEDYTGQLGIGRKHLS